MRPSMKNDFPLGPAEDKKGYFETRHDRGPSNYAGETTAIGYAD